jgi:hypothetical protein
MQESTQVDFAAGGVVLPLSRRKESIMNRNLYGRLAQKMSDTFCRRLSCLLLGLSLSPLPASTLEERVQVKTSIINTTFNTFPSDSGWEATMGPLTKNFGGIACDNVAAQQGDPQKFRRGDYAVWFVAPSDNIPQVGLKRCGPNPYGGEPSCVENWSFCGRKMRITCKPGSRWCAPVGGQTLLGDMIGGKRPLNNYIPEYYVDKTKLSVGAAARVPRSVVLYITDFCPANHSENTKTNQCQTPQLDISTSAFLMLAQQNAQGYIDSGLELDAHLLPEGDPSPAGPEYGFGESSPGFPSCQDPKSDPDGDGWGWENGQSCRVS